MEDNYIYDAIQVGAIAASPAIYSYGKNKYDNKYSSFFQSAGRMLPGSEYLDQQLNTSTGLSLNSSSNGLQKSLLSSLMALEEMSPLHILRTLQLSNLIQPFTEISNNNQEIHIAGRQLRGQEAFYRALIEKESRDVKNKIKRELTSQDLTRGMYFLNNKIYGATAQGTINTSDIILDNAKLVTATLKNGDIYSPNRLLEKYANTLGVTLNRAHMQENPLMFVGGSSSFKTDWARSALRYSMEVGYKTMDNPIAGVEELLGGLGAGNTKLFQTGAWRKLRDLADNFQMGTQGDYTLSTRESLKRVAKNTAIRGGAAYLGYEVADSALRFLSPSDGFFRQGIATGVANIYASSRIAFAELWSDRFQGYRQRQEEQAPGSTSLTTLMAFPLAGALLGAQIGYFGRVGSASLQGIEKSASKYNVETTSKLLETVGFKKDALYKPMKRNALVGGLLGALPALPFLPGALIGESSEELRSLYSGEKDVLDKSNRGWFFGGQSIDGERPTRFKKHIVARMNADATDKVRYGDDATKKSFNPFLHPFSYLNDPYKYEKLHAEDTPYPVWGMDVSFGGIFGKAFERTIGQVIKPDIVNPALKDQIESQSILGLKTAPGRSLKKLIGEEVESSLDPSLTSSDKALIRSGLMKSPQMAEYTPNKEALDLTYQALSDFTGIKGWVGSLAIDSLGIDTEVSKQLARSGEATSSARDLQDLNLGDLLGCLTPEMEVKTINGNVEIQNIREGDLVLSRGGVYRPVKQVFKKYFENIPIREILTESTKSIIRCTPDHKFNYIKREKYPCGHARPFNFNVVKAEAKDFNVGDMLVVPCITQQEDFLIDLSKYSRNVYNDKLYPALVKNYRHYNEKSKRKPVPRYLKPTRNLGKLLGWWLAEGSALPDGSITLSMHQDEILFARELADIVYDLFQFNSKISFDKETKGMVLKFSCKPFALFLRDVLGSTARFKRIPEYMKRNKEFCEGLAYGLIHGDGWYSNDAGGFTSISEGLTRDLSDILRICNIAHRCNYNYDADRSGNPAPNANEDTIYYPRNYIDISRNEVVRLHNLLEVSDSIQPTRTFGKSNRNFIKDNNQYVCIRSINDYSYTGYVYDLEITCNDTDDFTTVDDINFYVVDLIEISNSGEFQRKLLPTSAGALKERENPLINNSVSWLPKDSSKFYIDFGRGNPYSKIASGEERLAGVGFAALNPELQGVDPEDYSLVYRHRILSDVARGSKEHRATRSEALQAYREGLLSEREKEILETTLSQEEVLSQKKTFYEPPSQRVLNPVGIFQNTLWETMRKNAESPLEMLTPIRPAAKLLHQRTAIEDYIETQLGGTDSAIWTNPFSHFIKPAANKIRQTLTFGGTFLPEEAKEKYNIDEYFDKLDYLRKRRQGSEDYSLTTVIGASLSGLNTKDKILKFKSALSNDQKDYFESFSKETNEKKRDKIREILPEDVRRGYEQIWQNLDIARKAQASGKNVQYELASNISNQTKALSETFKVSLTKEDKEKARKIVERNRDSYVGVGIKEKDRVRFTEDEILRRKMADKESLTYINKRTGVPSTKFVGWDPRLTTDDIKIRTLDIGKEDLKRFGFWDKDEERMRSLRAITEDSDQIFSQIDRIKRELRSEREIKRKIEQTMFSKGFKTSNIQMVDSNYGSILVQEN